MDVALLLILPVIGGYFFSSRWNFTKFRCAREDGHRLYFRAALYGTFLFFAAYLLRVVLLNFSTTYNGFETQQSELLGHLLKQPDAKNTALSPSSVLITAIYALLLGLVSWAPLNLVFWVGPSLKRAIRDNDFERLIHTTARRGMPLSVTMENQKAYVGFVVKTIDPTQARKMLGILPLMSGYRRNDGRLKFTTYYTDIYGKIEAGSQKRLAHLSVDDFEIVLPVDKIQSANMFDIVAYEEFGHLRKRHKKAHGRRGKK